MGIGSNCDVRVKGFLALRLDCIDAAMQKPLLCRALFLHRSRALQRAINGQNRHLYQMSVSIVILLWGFFFLLNSWIIHSDGYTDGSEARRTRKVPLLLDAEKLGSISFPSCPVYSHQAEKSLHTEYSNQRSGADSLASTEEILAQDEVRNETLEDEAFRVQSDKNARAAAAKTLSSSSSAATGRFGGVIHMGFDEFKIKAISSKSRDDATGQARKSAAHRMEPGGGAEYNYASSSKGAKVLDYNKEAKGASNILNKDKDKYLRNPCSAKGKYVVVELSEEILIDTIKIANFEHHSSNLKELELLGSLVYPTDVWDKLGNFTAGNVRHAQSFSLSDKPTWVRYLKLNLLSHYGSEFYCTLSSVEVYGVDAIDRMLDDLIDNQHTAPAAASGEPMIKEHDYYPEAKFVDSDNPSHHSPPIDSKQEVFSSRSHDSAASDYNRNSAPDQMEELRRQKGGRMPSDSVLKILMQKVQALDLNLSVLEKYLEELNSRYGTIFREFDQDMEAKDLLLNRIRMDVKNLLDTKEVITEDVEELVSWKTLVSRQLDDMHKNNAFLRSEVRKVRENQMYMESKGIVLFVISLTFCIISLTTLCINMCTNLCTIRASDKSRNFCSSSSSWIFLLFSCAATLLIISL